MTERRHYIYEVVNLINGKLYVGKTCRVGKRWREHVSCAHKGSRAYFHKAIRCYGAENFQFRVVNGPHPREEIDAYERAYIAANKELGFEVYNLTEGGSDDSDAAGEASRLAWLNRSPAEREAINAQRRATFSAKSDEEKNTIRARIREAWDAKPDSELARIRLVQRRKMRTWHENMSDEERARHSANMSAGQKRRMGELTLAEKAHMYRKKVMTYFMRTTPAKRREAAARAGKARAVQIANTPTSERRAITSRAWETRRTLKALGIHSKEALRIFLTLEPEHRADLECLGVA